MLKFLFAFIFSSQFAYADYNCTLTRVGKDFPRAGQDFLTKVDFRKKCGEGPVLLNTGVNSKTKIVWDGGHLMVTAYDFATQKTPVVAAHLIVECNKLPAKFTIQGDQFINDSLEGIALECSR